MTTSVTSEVKAVQPLSRISGGWRASLGHGLIGRLGAAFVAATSGHHSVPQTPTLRPNGVQQMNNSIHVTGGLREQIRESTGPAFTVGSRSDIDTREVGITFNRSVYPKFVTNTFARTA